MKKGNTLLNSIGDTPSIKMEGIDVKLEYLNPSGSIKDRMARYIVEKAEKEGKLKSGYRIVEASSGNTGIAFSMVGALKGYDVTIVMPRGLSKEREQMIKGLGANLEKVEKNCFRCAINRARKLSEKKKTYFADQFNNEWNVEENEKFLGKEIIEQIKNIDAFVAGVGTGGTLVGVGKALKEHNPDVKLYAVEPAECPLLKEHGYGHWEPDEKKHVCNPHSIEGIADGIIPGIMERNKDMIDDVIEIKSSDAIKETKRLAGRGYLVGVSSGANLLAAKEVKKKHKNVVTVFPDRGERYLSEHLYD